MGTTKFSTTTALALAAVVLSSTTTVFAVASLPKHSVGTKQLKTSAVKNKKIAPHAVTSSKVAPNTFVGASRIAFGKGNATSPIATTLLSLPGVKGTVTTDGDADTDPVVVVNLPMLTTYNWFVNSSDGSQLYSYKGGPLAIGAPTPVTSSSSREVTAHIWRNDSTQAIYVHCTFDTTGFSSARPLSCWAMST